MGRRDDNAIGQSGLSPVIIRQNGMGNHRGRRIFISPGEHHLDPIGRQHFQRGCVGRERQRVGINAQIERAIGSLLFSIKADRLGNRQNMIFIKRPLEGRAAMP